MRLIPGEVVDAILIEGRNPLRVIRKWRGLTQSALAEKANLRQAYLSELEAGKKTPSVEALRALARALDIDVETLLPPED